MIKYLPLVFFFCTRLLAQSPSVNLFQPISEAARNENGAALNQHISTYTLIQPDQLVWSNLLAERPQSLTLTLPFEGGLTLELEKTNPLAHDFILTASNASGGTDTLEYDPGLHYSGKIAGEAHSLVAISIFADQIMGVISDVNSNINIGRVNTDAARAANVYVVFRDVDLVNPPKMECGTPDEGTMEIPVDYAKPGELAESNLPVNACPVRIFIDCDQKLFFNQNSNTVQTTNFVTANFNIAKTIFNNENVAIELSEVHVWTTPDPFSNANSDAAIWSFKNHYTPIGFNGRLAHLVSGDNHRGYGWIDKLCSNNWNYGYTNMPDPLVGYPNYSWQAATLTHELGHNFGSAHTHYCGWPGGAIDNCFATEPTCQDCPPCPLGPPPVNGGTIMSYCYNFPLSNGFGPMPGWVIRDRAMNAGCIKPLNDYYNQPTVCGCTPDPADVQELINLFNATGGANWTNKTNWWNYDNYNWHGVRWVKVGNKCRVRYIDLHENGLAGQIPNLNLPELQRLILDKNQLGGQIPNFNLPKLFALQLDSNQLSGTIPNFNFPEMWYLDLTHNRLSGSIPNFNFPKVEHLWLADNQLTGVIPIFNMPKMKILWLGNNKLTGSIPNFNWVDLEYLGLYNNQLSGNIPNLNLPNMERLILEGNNLNGQLPNFNTPKMRIFSLAYNQLSGTIPNFNFPKMQWFSIGNNNLSGQIPNFNFPDIRLFWLAGNQLSGQIPNFNFPKVSYFGLHYNQLSGTIPNFNFPLLDTFSIEINNLTFNGHYQFFPNNLSYFTYQAQNKIPTYTTPNCNTLYVKAGGVIAHNTYKWYKVGTGLVATIVGDSLYTPTLAGQYYCEVTNSVVIGLTLTSETVQKGSTYVAISGATSFCSGGNTVLNAGSGYASYLWSNGATTQQITANGGGNYSVTVSVAPGCTGTAQVTVTSVAYPQPSISSTLPAICTGATPATLNAGSGYGTYLWSNGNTTQIIDVSQPGTYTVTVTNAPGCSGTASYTLNALAAANPVVSGIAPICPGQNLTLSVGSFAAYNWSTGSTANSITVNQPGTYTVTVTNAAGCSGIANAIVPTNPVSVSIMGDQQICTGGFAVLDAGSGFISYAWSNGATTRTNEVTTSGFFTVTVTNAQGCTGTATLEMAEVSEPAPQVDIQGLTTVCGSGSTVLNAGNGFSSYTWSTGSTAQNITVAQAGNYAVTVTGAGNCKGKDEVIVTFVALPTPQISGVTGLCNGLTATLSANSGFQTYLWNTGSTATEITISQSGTYSITVTNAAGCTGSVSWVVSNQGNGAVVVTPLPAGTATPSSGDTVTYSISPVADAMTYTWTPPPGCSINGNPAGQTVTLPAASGTSVSVTFGCGWGTLCVEAKGDCIQSEPACKNLVYFGGQYKGFDVCASPPGADAFEDACIYASLNGVMGSNIGYTPVDLPINFCAPSVESGVWYGFVATSASMTFTATPISSANGNGIQLALTDADKNTLDCNFGSDLNYPNPVTVSSANLTIGELYFLFIDGFAGDECEFILSTTPVSNGYQVPSLGTIGAIQGANGNCPNSSVVMSVIPVQNATGYTWQAPSGALINGLPSPVILGAGGNAVTVTFSNAGGQVSVNATNGCQTVTATTSINIAEAPNVSISSTVSPCVGQSNGSATVTASGGVPPYTYIWSNGQTGATADNLVAGNHFVTVTGNNGCSGNSTATLVDVPVFHIDLSTNVESSGQTCQSSAVPQSGISPFTYYWSNGQTTQTASGLPSGQLFSVTVTDASGCISSQSGSCMPVSTNEIEGIEFYSVKPNPANSYLSIQIRLRQPENLRIRFFNSIGQQLYESSFNSTDIDEVIDLNQYPTGCYFIQFTTRNGSKSEIITIAR